MQSTVSAVMLEEMSLAQQECLRKKRKWVLFYLFSFFYLALLFAVIWLCCFFSPEALTAAWHHSVLSEHITCQFVLTQQCATQVDHK